MLQHININMLDYTKIKVKVLKLIVYVLWMMINWLVEQLFESLLLYVGQTI